MRKLFTISIITGLFSCGSQDEQSNIASGSTVTNPDTPPPAVRAAPVQNTEKAKIKIYNNVTALMAALSKNGIGKFAASNNSVAASDFKIDAEKYAFGKDANKSAINYSVAGKNEVAQTVTLVMNINAKSDRKGAMELFKKTTEKTFKTVDVDLPLPVSEAMGYGKSKSAETKSALVAFKVDKGNPETWTLTITSK